MLPVGAALVLASFSLAALPRANAAAPSWPADDAWLPLTVGGVPVTDPVADTALASAIPAADIVGADGAPAALWAGDAAHLYLRMAVAGDPEADAPASWVWMGLQGEDPSVFQWRTTLAGGTLTGDRNTDGVAGLVVPVGVTLFTVDRGSAARVVDAGDGRRWLDIVVTPAMITVSSTTPFRMSAAAGAPGGLTLPGADQWGGDDADGLDHLAERWSDPISFDEDGDGVGTAIELRTGTDPAAADSDGGGRDDGAEDRDADGAVGPWETDPRDAADDPDTDHDGIADTLEATCTGGQALTSDSDEDGRTDTSEGLVDSDGDGLPDFCDADDDDDGIPTVAEGDADIDGDGYPAYLDDDTDGDGIPDSLEGGGDEDCDAALDYADATPDDGPCADPDADGLDNAAEDACGSDPYARDSDGDGLDDPAESCTTDADCDQLPDRIDGVADTGFCVTPDDAPADTACVDADPTDPWHDCPGALTGGGGCSTVAPGHPLAALGWLALGVTLAARRSRSPSRAGR